MKRVFAAINISEEARSSIAEHVRSLRPGFNELRISWVRPENMHITVKFAGDLDGDGVKRFTGLIEKTAAGYSPFELCVKGTGAFIKRRGPSVLWIGIEDESDTLAGIVAEINNGFGETERRRFNPHLTIARLKDPHRSKPLVEKHFAAEFAPIVFNVSDIVVYESTLQPTGSVYTCLSRVPLAK